MGIYSNYNEKQYNNQKTYLENKIKEGGGVAVWAKDQMDQLNSQYKPQTQPTQPSTPSTGGTVTNNNSVNTVNKPATSQPAQTQAQQQAIANNSTGKTGTANDNKYGTIHKYTKDGGYYTSTDGGKTFINAATGEQMAGNTAQSSAGLTGGWNSIGGGKSGKQYEVYGNTGSIIVTYGDGSYRIVNPTDSDYMATRDAMAQDLADNGINYTPSKTWDVTKDYYKIDGSGELDYSQDEAYTIKDYLTGNTDLQYALEQWMKNNGTNVYDIEAYAKELYGNIGKQRADGSVITLADVNKELDRLGLSDYNSQNAIYTSSGALLPNNPFVDFTTGQVMGSGDGLDFSNGEFANYNGQQYLIGGDVADYFDYAAAKAGQTTLLDLLFGNMQNNPYAQGDAAFMQQYNNALNQFNNAAGITGNTGGFTGNANVDNVINYVNSLNNYNSATGGNFGTTNLLDMLQGYLDGGLQANQDFLAQQRSLAEQQAQRQASDAYVNQILQGDAMKQMLSAQGLGTSGALQNALMGVQGNYNNNLNEIQSNLNTMLSGLSEQELQLLTDYYNNMANYAYKVTNDEADRAYRNAQLALQQQQAQYDEAYRQQQLALQQQQYEWDNAFKERQYSDSQSANKQTGGNAYAPSKQGGVAYENTSNINLDIINPNNPQTGGEVTPQVNPEVQANWQGSMDNLMNVDLPTALNLISGIGSVSQVQAPQAMDANQLAQIGMGAYNNATANMSAPASSYLNQTELQKKINEALALINNGSYSY